MSMYVFVIAASSLVFVFSIVVPYINGLFIAARKSKRKNTSSSARKDALTVLMLNGITAFYPLAKILCGFEPVEKYVKKFASFLNIAIPQVQTYKIASFLIGVALIILVACVLVMHSLISGLFLFSCVMVVLFMCFTHVCEKKKSEEAQQSSVVLQSLRTSFQSGKSLEQSFLQVSKETHGSCSKSFNRAASSLNLGIGAHDVLKTLEADLNTNELAFVVCALDVQRLSGGSLSEIFLNAEESVYEQAELNRMLKTKTAQARLSAKIVSIMPFAILAVFSLSSTDFISSFFESALGIVMFVFALVLICAGIVIMKNMLKVEGVSQ
jgi:tight adherence protein B